MGMYDMSPYPHPDFSISYTQTRLSPFLSASDLGHNSDEGYTTILGPRDSSECRLRYVNQPSDFDCLHFFFFPFLTLVWRFDVQTTWSFSLGTLELDSPLHHPTSQT